MLLRNTKISYYEKLNVKCIQDNKTFWKHVKPLFSQKSCVNNRITLIEDDEIISDSSKCAEIMNNLDINRELHTGVSNSADPIISAIQKYKNHLSILTLDERMPIVTFNLKPVSEKDIKYIILRVDSTKAFQKDDIPPTILKANEDICSIVLTSDINRCIVNGTFPNNLKKY